MSQAKVFDTPERALDGLVRDGMTVAVGGFGLCGIPERLILAVGVGKCIGGGARLAGIRAPRARHAPPRP
ncbi:MAG: CoA-transferase, partial [Phycisphaerales bacterium]